MISAVRKSYRKKPIYRKKTTRYVRKPIARPYRVPPPEVKHFDVSLSQNVLVNGTLNRLTSIAQGVDDTQRIGNVLYLRSVYLNYTLNMNSSSTYDNVRVIVLCDKQGYNTPGVVDIVEPGNVGGNLAPISQYNHYYLQRFRILYDKIHTLSLGKTESIIVKRMIKLGFRSHFIGAGTTFANQVYILVLGSNTNILQLPVMNTVSRIIYNDN